MAIVICWFWISFSSATLFHLEINTWTLSDAEIAIMKDEIANKLMPIHFADNWNDFGWFFYFSNGLTGTDSTSKNLVTIQNDTGFDCDNQVRWYYYNAERWERLRPLDEDTKNTRKDLDNSQGSQGELTLNWWIYTVCTVNGYNQALTDCWTAGSTTWYEACIADVRQQFKADDNGYYWYIEHEYSWQTMALVAGVDYKDYNYSLPDKFVTITWDSKFSPTFIRYLNQNPIWFIYDYNWWIGLVWCKFKRKWTNTLSYSVKKTIELLYSITPLDLKNFFYISWDKIELSWGYNQYIDCSNSNAVWSPVLSLIIEWIIWLADEQKVWYIGTDKNDKMQYFSTASINNSTLINYAKKKAEILCRWKWKNSYSSSQWTNSDVVCINGASFTVNNANNSQKNKTYIVKNWSVTISPEGWCVASSLNNNYYDIAIINSWNLIINETDPNCVFTGNGFVMGSDITSFKSAVSSAALSGLEYDFSAGAAVWSYIKWNFIVDGYIKGNGSELKNKYFVYWKLTTKDDFNTLLSTFSWRCNYWLSTEEHGGGNNFCPNSLYQWAPLTVIDQNYPSPFYNS